MADVWLTDGAPPSRDWHAVLCAPGRAPLGLSASERPELADWDLGAPLPDFPWRGRPPSGVGVFDVGRRLDGVIDELIEAPGEVLVVAQDLILRILGARWVGLPPGDGGLLALEPGTVSVLGREGDVRVLRRWNAPR